MDQKIRVFLVEDYKIMRDGLRHLLGLDPDVVVVGECRSGEELLRVLPGHKVDILLLDIFLDAMEDLAAMNGFQICASVRKQFPDVKVICHSAYDDAARIAAMLHAGAEGFVSKKAGYEELVHAIKVVHQGERYICRQTSGRLKNLKKFLLGIEDNLKGKDEMFSAREREVLVLMAEGKSSREIADKLFVTERTVETHRKHMLEKMNAKNTAALVAIASSLGLVKK